ncbi:MAG: hypothetical protein U0X20_33165 [Caldilineaceae bacterium]
MLLAVFWGGLAATSLLIGYFLAKSRPPSRIIGIIMGIGAGALIGAIAYDLIPEPVLTTAGAPVSFLVGALIFHAGNELVKRRGGDRRKSLSGEQQGGSGAAIFVGTMLDNIPESIILGMTFAMGGAVNLAFLLAVFVSNLPEGVGGTVNLARAGYAPRKILGLWILLVVISAGCAGFGYLVLSWYPTADGHNAQAFAAGAMLTMLADAMMPEAFDRGRELAGIATVIGFLATALLAFRQ